QNPAQQAEFDNIIAPLREWEVTHQLERLADRPLLLWHGQEDDDLAFSRQFPLPLCKEMSTNNALTFLLPQIVTLVINNNEKHFL
ncbi:hypothetical protein MJM83_30795, partial [Salmonella enterica subsp. enterica serovar Montevideo]|nr:hypothetical protein [Salmonella enterica subsp. enterica serovar Montevideo]